MQQKPPESAPGDSYRVETGTVAGSVVVGRNNRVETHVSVGRVERLYLPALQPRGPVDLPQHFDPRPYEVVGRDDVLAELAGWLDRPGVVCVALVGLGGVGKTTIAVEFAYRHAGDYHVLWHIHAESDTTLQEGFDDLAVALGLGDAPDPVDAVHSYLASASRRWLLVFDNVTDYAAGCPAAVTGMS